jgi:hypothetical protein
MSSRCTSFEGIIESALKAPVNASEWKLWEVPILTSVCTPAYFWCVRAIVASACLHTALNAAESYQELNSMNRGAHAQVVHFLRKAQDSLRHPKGTRGTHKARALRWAVGTLGAMSGPGRRLSITSTAPVSAVQLAAPPMVQRDNLPAEEPLAYHGGQVPVPVPHRDEADTSSGVFKQRREVLEAETKDAGGGDEAETKDAGGGDRAGLGANLPGQPQVDAPTPIPEDVAGEGAE